MDNVLVLPYDSYVLHCANVAEKWLHGRMAIIYGNNTAPLSCEIKQWLLFDISNGAKTTTADRQT